MYDVGAIETINTEQRQLLSKPRRRPSASRFAVAPNVVEEPTASVRGAQLSLGIATQIAIVSAALGAALGALVVAASTLLGSR